MAEIIEITVIEKDYQSGILRAMTLLRNFIGEEPEIHRKEQPGMVEMRDWYIEEAKAHPGAEYKGMHMTVTFELYGSGL